MCCVAHVTAPTRERRLVVNTMAVSETEEKKKKRESTDFSNSNINHKCVINKLKGIGIG